MGDEKSKNKFSFLDNLKFIKKIKQVKHIGLIITIIFIIILLLIAFGNFNFSLSEKSNDESSQHTSTYTSYYEYAEKLESKLKNVLTKIKDAGTVEVMITLDGGVNLIYATEDEKTISNNGQTTTTSGSTIIISTDGQEQPIIVGEQLPKITGVVVVSSGASDVSVRLNLLYATQTLLDVEQDKIQIFVGN